MLSSQIFVFGHLNKHLLVKFVLRNPFSLTCVCVSESDEEYYNAGAKSPSRIFRISFTQICIRRIPFVLFII